jgi:hypothetical protein
MWLQEARVPHAPVSAWPGKNDMARGSHAPEGSRARGSAWITIQSAWERVEARGSHGWRVEAREARRQTGRMVPERVDHHRRRVGAREARWQTGRRFQSAWKRLDHHGRRVRAREERRQTGRSFWGRV